MLLKQTLWLIGGLFASYACSDYIFNSPQFESYMLDKLADYENPAAAMIGLAPPVILLMNLVFSIIVHLIVILGYKILESSKVHSLVKRTIFSISICLFLLFCSKVVFNVSTVNEGYYFVTVIPYVFWTFYGLSVLMKYFKSHRNQMVSMKTPL